MVDKKKYIKIESWFGNEDKPDLFDVTIDDEKEMDKLEKAIGTDGRYLTCPFMIDNPDKDSDEEIEAGIWYYILDGVNKVYYSFLERFPILDEIEEKNAKETLNGLGEDIAKGSLLEKDVLPLLIEYLVNKKYISFEVQQAQYNAEMIREEFKDKLGLESKGISDIRFEKFIEGKLRETAFVDDIKKRREEYRKKVIEELREKFSKDTKLGMLTKETARVHVKASYPEAGWLTNDEIDYHTTDFRKKTR